MGPDPHVPADYMPEDDLVRRRRREESQVPEDGPND